MNWARQIQLVVVEPKPFALDIAAPEGPSLSASLSPLFIASFVYMYRNEGSSGAWAPELPSLQGKVRGARLVKTGFALVFGKNERAGKA